MALPMPACFKSIFPTGRILGLALAAALAQGAAAQTSVEAFTPEGTVKGVRQVTARFSGQIVPFGDLRLEDPFAVDCPEKGTGRWVDGRNWSYDFERDLPAGVNCRFSLKPGLKDLAGKALEGERAFAFSTGGPAIIESVPYEGTHGIDENQLFILGLDAVARADTIEKNAWCSAAGINEKVGVRLVTGKQRDDILAQRKYFIDRILDIYFKARGMVWKSSVGLNNQRIEKLPIVILQCTQTLPSDKAVRLVWGAGIAADTGVATTEDQALAFRTRPDFSARFGCTRTNSKANCIPFLPMSLGFSAPVRASDAREIRLTGPKGKVFKPRLDDDGARGGFVNGITFHGPFPEDATFKLGIPAQLKDDAGRQLLNQARFPLTVKTDVQPPLVKFPARFGIIESRGERMLPVTVRNVEAELPGIHAAVTPLPAVAGASLRVDDEDQKIIGWLKRLSGSDSLEVGETYHQKMVHSVFDKDAQAAKFAMPKPNGRRAFEVIGIPLKASGFHVVELESPRLGAAITASGGTAFVQSAALVTNLAAHFKRGAESSLVWVTTLDRARPVAAAKVAVRGCNGKLLWQGVTDKSGLARIAQSLPIVRCGYVRSYFVSARHGGDMTFTLSDWARGIERWRFNVRTDGMTAQNIMATTVFDRTLLRAGETVHMKHFLRKHTLGGVSYVTADERNRLFDLASQHHYGDDDEREVKPGASRQLIVMHEGSAQKYEFPLSWSAHGTAESTWKIPPDARQGTYSVLIGGQGAGSLRVEAFRVPTMKAILAGPRAPLVQASAFELDVQLNYLAGGAASNAPVKLRTVVHPKAVTFEDYPDLAFSNGDVAEGVVKSGAAVDDDEMPYDEADSADGAAVPGAATTRALALDHEGAARIPVGNLPKADTPQDLLAELEYQDANGETLAVSTRVPLWPSSVLVAVKPDGWALSKDAFKFQVLVLGIDGKPAPDTAVSVDFMERKTYSHRRRLIGGFYAYENVSEVKRLGLACEGRTDAKGLLFCEVKAPASGNLILRARAADGAGHPAVAHREVWVAGSEDWWFDASDNDRIDVLPEKKRYELGEDATFQVRMPFRAATALVTVEREGIIDSYIRPLSGKAPGFTIPIKKHYAPNVYVSVLVVRGRVGGVKPTALVDLGKPAYKMGMAKLRVGWAGHELKVAVTTDKEIYKVRDKARVKVRLTRPDGSPAPAGSEFALAAVDVGLLELMPNDSWDLLEAMMQERGMQVETSTAQMQVVGKRHFGRKAVAPGGGGGKGSGRELFETLLFWKGRVAVDANGEASVEVPLNDSLSAFRIVAVASANADLFGTGKADIRSTQDLILMSGLPALVRADDRFRAGFTLRNTSDAALTVDLTAAARPGEKAAPLKLAPRTVAVAPGQAAEVGWDYRVPAGTDTLVWEVEAKARDGAAGDRLRLRQKVADAVPVRIYQATLVQLDKPLNMSVQAPADALPGRGGIRTLLKARLGDELPGVKEYMAAYPYTCFEQLVSKAVSLRDEALWQKQAGALPAYLDDDGLVKYFPMMAHGSDALTAYVLSVAAEAGYAIPESSKRKMEDALVGFVQGRIVRHSALPTADVAIRKVAALEALSRAGRVQADMLESFAVEPKLWPTSAVIDWYLVLERTAALPGREAQLVQAGQILRSRLNFQGTTMGFSTERKDDLWWLMASPDVNANRILLAMLDNPSWREDIGRLVRGTLGRQHKGRWRTTLANAWGTLAIEKFSARFESVPVAGSTSVALGGKPKAFHWENDAGGGALTHAWPAQRAQLAISHQGSGKPWATVQSMAAIPLTTPVSSGYRALRTVTPVEQKVKGQWSRGDVYRVRLDLEAQSDMTWVVVDDPIPASASVLGTGLGRDSKILGGGEKRVGWVWPAFEERTFAAFRAYYEFVPKGKWTVEYTVRLNNEGDFQLPATRIEAMYSPEMFGEFPNAKIRVLP